MYAPCTQSISSLTPPWRPLSRLVLYFPDVLSLLSRLVPARSADFFFSLGCYLFREKVFFQSVGPSLEPHKSFVLFQINPRLFRASESISSPPSRWMVPELADKPAWKRSGAHSMLLIVTLTGILFPRSVLEKRMSPMAGDRSCSLSPEVNL